MGTFYGIKPYIVKSTDVNSITLNNATIDYAQTGDYGFENDYQIYVTHASVGCGTTNVYLELKDNITWKYVTFEILMTGTAACWGFCNSSYTPSDGNILGYDEAAGDVISRCLNSWEVPLYQTHNRTSACDNNEDNFMRYDVLKTFIMKRRRNVNGSKAGISHGRACSGAGTTLIRKIRIWN